VEYINKNFYVAKKMPNACEILWEIFVWQLAVLE
jgi:hypothetical protein